VSVRAKLIASFGALMTIILALGGIIAVINFLHVQDDAGADPVWVVIGFAVAITGIVSGIVFIYLANRDITQNISEIARVARAVEIGDLDQHPRIETHDEFYDLGAAIDGMTGYLQQLADYAQDVATGNLDASVTPRSDRDVLGLALHEMAGSLRRLVDEASEVESLRRLDVSRRELLNNVSHNLRTPLGIIKGAVSSVLEADRELDDSFTEFLEMADSECDYLDAMVARLLQTAALGQQSVPPRRDPTDLGRLIEVATRRAAAQFTHHNIHLLPPPARVQALVDPAAIQQVLLDLVDNAAKYSLSNTTITIGIDLGPESVRVTVTDQGPGIDPEFHDRIFERFFRAPPGRSARAARGTGLGLAIARGLIEQNNGKIWVESEPGAGSSFIFTLPRLEV
jgi:signal transduction histidine kinase